MSDTLVSLLLLPPEPHSADAHSPGAAGTRHSFALQGAGPWELIEPPAAAAPGAAEVDSPAEPAGADEPDVSGHPAEPTGTHDVLATPMPVADAYRTLVPEMLSRASGHLIGIVHAGDQLEPGALPALLAYLTEAGRGPGDLPGALYTDEQWPSPGASGIAAKPDFSIRHLRQYDAIGRLMLVRRDILDAAGGCAPGDRARDAAAAWDLRLRIAEESDDIVHVPVLGLWRCAPPATDDEYLAAGQRSVTAHLARLGVDAEVEPSRDAPGDAAGFLRVWRRVPGIPGGAAEAPLVSLVVPTGGGRRSVRGRDTLLVAHTLASVVDRTVYPNYEIVLVPSEGTDEAVLDECREVVARAGSPAQVRVAPAVGPFNFSASVNIGVAAARGEFVLLLNDDVEVLEPRWLDRMVSVAQDPQVGAVGAKLLFEDGTIQHVGIYFNRDGWVGHVHIFEPDEVGVLGAKVVDLDVLAVTGACLLVRRSLFEEVGGFVESLPLNFNDVDFCLKLAAAGYRCVVTPAARLHHFESSTRTAEVLPWEKDSLRWWRPRTIPDPNLQIRGTG